jgi:hypothetical protein
VVVFETLSGMVYRIGLWLGKIIKKHWFYLLLQAIAFAVAVSWIPYSRLPLPGYAVAAIAGLAAAMSLQQDMGRQKFVWMLLIGAFLVTELRAIKRDRDISDKQALNDRAAQSREFQVIREAENQHFDITAQGLQGAIAGLKETLNATRTVLEQTKPQAAIDLGGYSDNLPAPLRLGIPFNVVIDYRNVGGDAAKNIHIFAREYVATTDQDIARKELSERFEKDWKDHVKTSPAGKVLPRSAELEHLPFENPALTVPEINGLNASKMQIYQFSRFLYSDSTGTWQDDYCWIRQSRGISINCSFGMVPHQRAKQP